ncbi:MAG: M20/M25/M40 family metallo-hydrolase [Bacteroidales bacterium]|nr:M20/M25/M40 family metallo-hydrolase [Bacteroidales bacterium]
MTLFKEILSIDSTSGKEREMALWLHEHLEAPEKELMEVGDGTLNLFLRWGSPKVVFCSHMDTVPPYIPPTFEMPERTGHDGVVRGRGSCDAKGQVFAMYTACKQLEAAGNTGFGLLILAGEETGSWGAKAFSKTGFEAPFLIVGEPTENKMISASKGTKSYDLVFHGKAFHSGYPEHGVSAVERFIEFHNALKAVKFPIDPVLGETTWNIGLLRSDNPQNILSPELSCRIYFRTTFASDAAVQDYMAEIAGQAGNDVLARGGDQPAKYVTLPGFETAPASFGTDAPHLTGFGHKIICGPGTVLVAHRDDEHILLADIEKAVEQYIRMFKAL